LSTEDGGRTFEGCGTESHSCTSHVEEVVWLDFKKVFLETFFKSKDVRFLITRTQ
jgi:hypothetical protein